MEIHNEKRKSYNYVAMLLFNMGFDNGFSILFNLYVTQDMTCAGLPAAELCFIKATSTVYASCICDWFK
jgi:hypothetical protein